MAKIYIVKTAISSPNFIDETVEIDEHKKEITYRFDRETRKAINRIRMNCKYPIYSNTLDFHSLYIAKQEQVKEIKDAVSEADKKLKEVNPGLKAKVMFIPLDLEEIKQGELYGYILSNIRYQVLKQVFDRMDKIVQGNQKISERTKKALLTMVENCKALNILNDEETNTQLEEIKARIQKEGIEPLHASIMDKLAVEADRWSALEV